MGRNDKGGGGGGPKCSPDLAHVEAVICHTNNNALDGNLISARPTQLLN